MCPIPKSGLYYPSKFALLLIKALEDVLGKNGINAILNLAGLSVYADNYPDENLEKTFDFSDVSSIYIALENMYGPRGGRGMAQRAGRAAFADGHKSFGVIAGVSDLAFRVLPLQTKLRIGLPAFAKIFSQLSDQFSTVIERETDFLWTIYKCPVCWGRTGLDKPVCFSVVGLLQESLKWVSGGDEFRVYESKCHALGDEVCEFVISKEPMS